MLCLHVPSLLPHPFADMDTSSVTQAAALAGVGLLYQVRCRLRRAAIGKKRRKKRPCICSVTVRGRMWHETSLANTPK